jgi:YD repeat-containing protein
MPHARDCGLRKPFRSQAARKTRTCWRARVWPPLRTTARMGALLVVCTLGIPAEAVTIAGGRAHSAVAMPDGSVRAWGANSRGQLGDGTLSSRSLSAAVPGLANVVAVSAGDDFLLALKSDGSVVAWGANDQGQLGNGSTDDQASPVLVTGLSGVVRISAGARHAVALKADGSIWTWGANDRGQLGDGTTQPRSTPAAVSGLSLLTAVGAGNHTLAIDVTGSVWNWGANERGQLGDGTTSDRATPWKIPGLTGVVAVAGSAGHSLALSSSGSVRGWGANDRGQLGDGTTIDRATPGQVAGLPQVTSVTTSVSHSLALGADGRVWAWGGNSRGALGNDTTADSAVPIVLAGIVGAADIASGDHHSLVVGTDGRVWSWGGNDGGALGNGDFNDRRTPQLIALAGFKWPEAVVWTAGQHVAIDGNSVTKLPGPGIMGGAISTKGVSSGDAYVEFTVSETMPRRGLGLSVGNSGVSEADVDFLLVVKDGHLRVYESGVLRFGDWVARGDRLRVAIEAGIVVYRRNGKVLGKTVVPGSPLLVDSTLSGEGANLENVTLAGSLTTVAVATPVLAPLGGAYPTPQDVVVTTSSSGPTIYFTTDGTVPTDSGNSVPSGGMVAIEQSATLKARAFQSGLLPSGIAEATYQIGTAPCLAGSQTFTFTGSLQSWIVPWHCTTVRVKAWGAGGGGAGTSGGGGGHVQGRLSVSPGEKLTVLVGGGGGRGHLTAGGAGGYAGGGNGGSSSASWSGGGGGGRSALLRGTEELISAGGGGGSSGNYNGSGYTAAGGAGGGATGHAGATVPVFNMGGGGGGTQTAGGAGGNGQSQGQTNGQAGWAFQGGSGGSSQWAGNGGGGGGFFGGGSGGLGNVSNGTAGGGGGGSGRLGTGVTGTLEAGSGSQPGAAGDAERAGAGLGGAPTTAGAHGRVILSWSANQPPQVSVQGSSCHTPCTATFQAIATDVDGDSLTYTWGGCADGQTGPTATCSLMAPGTTEANVTVDDGFGGSTTASGVATGTNVAPVIQDWSGTGSCQAPCTRTFTVTATDADGDTLTYAWDFGDGSTDTGPDPSHTYAGVGSYTVTLTVDDGHGLLATRTGQVSAMQVESVVWTHIIGATPNGNSLQKTAVQASDAGAISVVKIDSGDGWAEFSVANAADVGYVGLGHDDSGQDGADIEYAFRLGPSQSLSVYESGVLRGTYGTYSASDRLRVAIESGTVKYSRNGTVLHQSSVPPDYTLTVDTALHDTGATVTNVQIAAAALTTLDGPPGTTSKTPTDWITPAGMAPGSPAGSYVLSGFDTVNLFSGNLNVALPLRGIKGRGEAGYDITLRLERNWAIQRFDEPREGGVFETFYFPHDDIWSMVGGPKETPYAAAFAVVRSYAEPGPLCPSGQRQNSSLTRVVFMLPDGTSHDLFAGGVNTSPCPPGLPFNRGRDFVSKDASGLHFRSDADIFDAFFDGPDANATGPATGNLLARDGRLYRFDDGRVSWIRDRNGNRIEFSYPPLDLLNPGQPPNQVTDSLGRVTHIEPVVGACNGDRLTFGGAGGAERTVKVCRVPLADALAPGQTLQTLGGLFAAIADRFPPGYGQPPSTVYNPDVVSRVELPNGRQYTFTYTSFARVAAIVLPTGGRVEYGYAPMEADLGTLSVRQRVVERRMLSVGGGLEQRVVYAASAAGSDWLTEVTRSDGSGNDLGRERHFFFGRPFAPPAPGLPTTYGKEFRSQVFDGATLLRTTEDDWGNGGGVHDFAIAEERVTLHDGPTVTARRTFGYDAFTNRISTTEYGFDGAAVRRRCTRFLGDPAYAAPPVHLISLPVREVVYEGQGGDAACNGDGVARTSYGYDAAGLTSREGASGHDDAYGPGFTRRGNLTSVHRVVQAGQAAESVTQHRYDVLGNVVRSIDPRGFVTNVGYADAFAGGGPASLTFAFATRVTNPLGHESRARYDYSTGQPVQQTDANGVTTDFEFDDPLERLTGVVAASNDDARSRTEYAYLDDQRIVRSARDLRQFGDGILVSETDYDGFGRLVETRQHTPEGQVTVETRYDGMGQVDQVSNPFLGGPAVFTTTRYDALGRVVEVETPDGARTLTDYSSDRTTVTDAAGHSRLSRTDALGRVVQVIEDPGQANLSTNYSYDALDNLESVGQSGQARTFSYDSLSRLKSATNPESGRVRYPQYDASGNLLRRIDARGVATDYTYDELGRILSRSYSGGSEVEPTGSVTYSYDRSGSHALGRLSSISTGTSDTLFNDYDALGRVTAQSQRTNGRFYDTAYEYNRAGLLTAETYPSGRTLALQHDDAGRLSGVTGTKADQSPITFVAPGEVSYAPHGAVTGMGLGNGLWESTVFNDRRQPTAIRLGTVNGGDNLLRLNYAYHPPGPASANNGNVHEQAIAVPGASFLQSYGYDRLNRLKTVVEQRAGGNVWEQMYHYDAFGNRRATGYLPSPNLTPSAPGDISEETNQLQKGSAAYDSAGNLTRDPVDRAFAYDGENRQVSFVPVTGALPVTYGYDGEGRRVLKKETSGRTYVYVYDAMGHLVTEHSDEDPELPVKDYVYAGSRLIAEVKGAGITGDVGLGLIGPVGIVDNCAEDANFEFSWYRDPAATQYDLKVDGVTMGRFPDTYCFSVHENRPACVVEPQANPTVEPFAPGQHHWAVRAIYGTEEGPWSPESYYVIGPRPATPLEPHHQLSASPTTFRWVHSPEALEYKLFIDGVQRHTFDPAVVCGETECVGTPQPPLNLAPGPHSWRIHGVFPECEVSSLPLDFSVGGTDACGIVRHSPPQYGLAVLPLVFRWFPVPGVNQYDLWVTDSLGTQFRWPVFFEPQCGPLCEVTAQQLAESQPYSPGEGWHSWRVGPWDGGASNTASNCEWWGFQITGVSSACEPVGHCTTKCTVDVPCLAPCIDPETNQLTNCSYLNRPCDESRTCNSCASLGGACGTCEGSAVLAYTADCNFGACCNTATDTCAQRAGPDYRWRCPEAGEGCQQGFNATGPTTDCGQCCVATAPGPSCGELGGEHCSDTGACPNGFSSLGPTFDCDACCDALPTCSQAGGYCLGSCTGPYTPVDAICGGGLTCCQGPPPQITCSERGGVCSGGDPCGTGYHPDEVAPDCSVGVCCVPDDPGDPPATCGDGVCAPNVEDCGVCAGDCPCPAGRVCSVQGSPGQCVQPPPVCGDGVCAPNVEDCGVCAEDCPCAAGRVCNASNSPGQCVPQGPVCGDGVCAPNVEDCGVCAEDCPCPSGLVCNAQNAPGQCVQPGPVCGDGICAPNVEDCGVCAGDCPCPEGLVCNAQNSPGQCVQPGPVCGDGICSPEEDCGICFADCACPPTVSIGEPTGRSATMHTEAGADRVPVTLMRSVTMDRSHLTPSRLPSPVGPAPGADRAIRHGKGGMILASLALGLGVFLRSRGMKKTALLIILVLLGSQVPSAAQSATKPSDPKAPVAQIGDRTITDAELDQLAAGRLARLWAEELAIKRQVLDEYITRTLLEREAASRGITPEELERREVEQKILPVTDDQKRAVYESNSQAYQGKTEAEAYAAIEANLKRVRMAEARRRLLAALRTKASVKVFMDPPRVEVVPVAEGPTLGPKDAPITIVEFSDYQCPYCARAQPVLKDLLQRYDGKLRLVFRDFPLEMHAQAPKAAEAARCALDQGKFWEMHDRLFANQRALQVEDLKRMAADLGLDTAKFATCLDSGRHTATWKADMEMGRRMGVNGTPSFFVNGRMITGAGSPKAFTDIIDQELARAGTAAGGR